MRSLRRGEQPASLLRAGVAEFAAAKLHFDGTGRQDGFTYKAYGAPDVKSALAAMSNGKCAYCEADYDATQPSDVEHFRPKGAIDTDAGRIKPGYWWLAATWENLLPSCIRCNRREKQLLFDGTELSCGKANQFPLVDEASRATSVGQEANEDPLLIDPCSENPADHLHFIDDGGHSIAVPIDPDPQSLSARKARATIDIFGLNRAGLVRDRSNYLFWAKLSLARLEWFAYELNALPRGADNKREEFANWIEQELDFLDRLTCGEGSYTGMLRALIDPKLAELNITL